MCDFANPQNGMDENLRMMENALALVHGFLFGNIDDMRKTDPDLEALYGAGELVFQVRFAIRGMREEIAKEAKKEQEKAEDVQSRLKRAEEILIKLGMGRTEGLVDMANAYFAAEIERKVELFKHRQQEAPGSDAAPKTPAEQT